LSNEIYHNFPSGSTLYALIHRKSDDGVNIIGSANFEAWVDGNIATYVLAMTDHDGDYYTVDFPATITDTTQQPYRITVRLQGGGSPVADGNVDRAIAQSEIFWDGVNEVDIGTINITNQTVTNIYDESTPPPVTVINV